MKELNRILAIVVVCGLVLSAIVFVEAAEGYDPPTGGGAFDDKYDLLYFDPSLDKRVTVKSGTNVGMYSSLAARHVTSPTTYDEIHVSYYDATNGDLRYAFKDNSGWTVEGNTKNLVDSAGNVGKHTSIALDSSGYPRISYYDVTNAKLKYAKWTGSAWSIENPDTNTGRGEYTSIVLDSSDNVHISYYDATNTKLRYAKYSGTWSSEYPETSTGVGEYTSIALDSSGNPRISYYDRTNGNLKYIPHTGAIWGGGPKPRSNG